MEGLAVQAQEAQREYKRQYRDRNREKINRQQREWRAGHPEKVKQYQKRYWEKVAENTKGTRDTKDIRASWQDYGISKERYLELQEVVRSGRYDAVVRSAAYTANKDIADYLIKSVVECKSYDELQKKWDLGEIERMPFGRSNFYGIRRLFFHYLDLALKDGKAG